MGLFSFLKNAGAKIFKKKDETKTADEIRAERIEALGAAIGQLELQIQDLSLEVNVDADTVTVYGTTESQEEREKIILALGNVEGIATVDDRISVVTPAPEAKFYEVKSGDTLGKIAKEFYGNAMKYPVIFEANKPMLKDPNLIYPGQVLRIPPID